MTGDNIVLETERLILRRFGRDDLGDLHEIFGSPEVMFFCEPAYTLEKTEAFLMEFCIERKPPGAFACVEKASGKVIGYLLFKETEASVYEAGWIFGERYWGRGYAYEACEAMFAYAFETLRAHKLVAETIDPVKSVELMVKLGMRREGVQRIRTRDNDGNWSDLYWYGITEDEYRNHIA